MSLNPQFEHPSRGDMNSRPANTNEERIVTAFHEAGHLVVTHASTYFGLRDPALRIPASGPYSAVSGAVRIRDTSAPEHHQPSTREFVKIALAGKAVEEELLRRQPVGGPRLIPNPAGANVDLANVRQTLFKLGMAHEQDQLWLETVKLVQEQWESIEVVAELIFHSAQSVISRDSVLAVLAARHDT